MKANIPRGKTQSKEQQQGSEKAEYQKRHSVAILGYTDWTELFWSQHVMWQLTVASGKDRFVMQSIIASRMSEDETIQEN